MTLNKKSVWYLAGELSFRPEVVIAKDTPQYIIDWFRKNRSDTIELVEEPGEHTNENPDRVYPIEMDRWPTQEEMDEVIDLDKAPLLINRSNYIEVKNLGMYKNIYTTTKGFHHYEYSSTVKFGTTYIDGKHSKAGDITYQNGEIVHLMKLYGNDKGNLNYRRYKLSRYLRDKYDYQGIMDIREMKLGKYKIAISSCSVGWNVLLDFDYDILVYDRTDNWSAWSKDYEQEEHLLIGKANIIFCSSKWLYEDTIRIRKELNKSTDNVYFIPNGCDVKPYKQVEKYSEITGCYIGKTDNKVDWKAIEEISKKYKMRIYGAIQPKFENDNTTWCGFLPEDELHEEISKCHFGLIPFVDGNWTVAMLPLKLFHYANAHIPTIYKNSPECEAYSKIAVEMDDDYNFVIPKPRSSDYEDVMKEADWKAKFDRMMEIIYDTYERHNTRRETE